jgi:thioredoxin 1
MTVKIDDSNFDQEVLQSEVPVLVDFWAQWCMPCRMVEPVVEDISNEYQGRLKVCKMNVDEARKTASEYRVMSIPTLAVFKNGELVDKIVGALPKDAIITKVTPYLD